jgi:hypothetical protein
LILVQLPVDPHRYIHMFASIESQPVAAVCTEKPHAAAAAAALKQPAEQLHL